MYYRSLTFSGPDVAASPALPVEFEILGPKSVVLPGSQVAGLTDHGVGSGSFHLPKDLRGGTYTLVARGWDDAFTEARLTFDVVPSRDRTSHQMAAEASVSDRHDPRVASRDPSSTGPLHFDFYPEGGVLAAGLENRIYFAARDGHGRPSPISGSIVNAKGVRLAKVNSTANGLGAFSFLPDAAETYRLAIDSPAGISESPILPPASAEQKIAISTGRGVLSPAPLEITVRATKDRLPLLVAARVRSVLVGQQMLVTSSDKQKGVAVAIPLDNQIAGVIRVTVYDCTNSSPQVLAERLVYRQPRQLVIRAAQTEEVRRRHLAVGRERKGQARRRGLGGNGA